VRILAINWRDIDNPEAGGAEVHLHEILTRMILRGHSVTQISTSFPGCDREVDIDGIRVLRRGRWYDANIVLPIFARRHMKHNEYDVVLEDINKLPFFMPLYTSVPVIPVIPHLFGSTAFRETNWAIASYVYLMEKFIPRVFRNSQFIVISPSTRDDLVSRGIDASRIHVVLCGLDHAIYRDLGLERFDRPTIVHLGRLRKYKSVDVVMKSMKTIRGQIPDARLVIIGEGPHKDELLELAGTLQLGDAIEFKGYMEQEELVEYLNRSHLLLNPSPKEGWGLTVVEANACGVPVVASDRPGLKDSVWDGETGVLVPYGDVEAFAKASIDILRDGELWKRMSSKAIERVGVLTWERCAREVAELLDRFMQGEV
jgi:glycosyltransferase involved in cell wall biosynthesis